MNETGFLRKFGQNMHRKTNEDDNADGHSKITAEIMLEVE